MRKTVVRTVLIVGEGYDEVAFLNHLKSVFHVRECGVTIKIMNARGKGAKGVVEWTARQAAIASYDKVMAMFDTDTDWNNSVAKYALDRDIELLKSEPCFEAMLLRTLGKPATGNAKTLKKKLSEFVSNDSTSQKNYETHFDSRRLEDSCKGEATIRRLLDIFKNQY